MYIAGAMNGEVFKTEQGYPWVILAGRGKVICGKGLRRLEFGENHFDKRRNSSIQIAFDGNARMFIWGYGCKIVITPHAQKNLFIKVLTN
ncbi:MAG: hypothetical protein CM15mP114_14270 [Alphaproteobacteria bacterium]|nr:MAG: hypothetical protein CM15mP114_14270 [Alphaproteobacteria bacterium]